jgi:hypothetical protein
VIRFNESIVMRVADGTDAALPSLWKGEALAGGARRPKCAHDDGVKNMNGIDQSQSLLKAFVNPKVELVVWLRRCLWGEHYRR